MSYPKKQVQTVDGISVVCKSFKTNLKVYKEIGGEVRVKIGKKRAKEVDFIRIKNEYYSRVGDTPYAVLSAEQNKVRAHRRKCGLKHWAVGIGVKIKFPGGDVRPSKFPKLMPLHGVVTHATVRIGGKDLVFITAKGPHPSTPEFNE